MYRIARTLEKTVRLAIHFFYEGTCIVASEAVKLIKSFSVMDYMLSYQELVTEISSKVPYDYMSMLKLGEWMQHCSQIAQGLIPVSLFIPGKLFLENPSIVLSDVNTYRHLLPEEKKEVRVMII